jgi:enoyl-CoA hydratase/carnithine racemase
MDALYPAASAVLCEVAEGVATITLNRPDRLNAWDGAMANQFRDAITRVRDDRTVRAVVLTGAGRGFCAGADRELLKGAAGGLNIISDAGSVLPTYLIEIGKPVIAAINGPAVGLGLVLALCCDVRFAAAGAKLAAAFPRLGLIAEYGSGWLLPRLVGTANAVDILMSGRVILAEDAARIGLVNRVVHPQALVGQAVDYARDLAVNCSPAAMRTIKRQVYAGFETGLEPALKESLRLMEASLQSHDFKEAIAAIGEKRAPRFADSD